MYSGNFDYDVIIVGAGISGLAAAYTIHEKDSNISFLVLEGNDRIGGRVQSTLINVGKSEKELLDIGGQFIGTQQTHLMTLLKKLDIKLYENVNNRGYTLGDFCEGNFYKTTTMPPIFGDTATAQDIMQFLGTLESMSSKVSLENPLTIDDYTDLDSMTMEAFMYNNLSYSFSRSYIRILIKMMCGAEPSDISVLFFLVFCNSTEGLTNSYLRTKSGGKGYWAKNTAAEICEKIATFIGNENIKINNAVAAITRSDICVLVRTAENEYKCRYVIMALPPEHILKVHFFPPLNDLKYTVLKRMQYRPTVKYIVTYRREFWRDMDYNGDLYCCRNLRELFPIMTAYNVSRDGTAVITGLLDVDLAEKKENHKNAVLTQLAAYFGREALEPLDYVEKSWSDDTYFFDSCAVCFPPPKMMKTFTEIRRPLGRLYFAGAETATYWYGHMAGAAQAGFRAAIEVLYELRPQCLTAQDFIDLKPRRTQLQFYSTEEHAMRNDWIVVVEFCENPVVMGVARRKPHISDINRVRRLEFVRKYENEECGFWDKADEAKVVRCIFTILINCLASILFIRTVSNG
ncbi:hypothetical protein Trydic_g14040 [Trypoxylus dichotomus]